VEAKDSIGRRARRRGRRLAGARWVALLAALALSLAVAAPAAAQNDPIQDQYCEEGVVNEITGECERVAVQDPADPGATVASDPGGAAGGTQGGDDRVIGSLPFTGVDLAVLGVVALVLLGAGFLLRHLSALREP
jgi:hypothetical protein